MAAFHGSFPWPPIRSFETKSIGSQAAFPNFYTRVTVIYFKIHTTMTAADSVGPPVRIRTWLSKLHTTVEVINEAQEDVICEWHFSSEKCHVYFSTTPPTVLRPGQSADFKLVRTELCDWHFNTTSYVNGAACVKRPLVNALTKEDVTHFGKLAKLEHPERNMLRSCSESYYYDVFPADVKHIITVKGLGTKFERRSTITLGLAERSRIAADVALHIDVSVELRH